MGHHQNGKNLLLQGAKKWSNLHSEVTAGWCKKNCAKGQISQLSETQFWYLAFFLVNYTKQF